MKDIIIICTGMILLFNAFGIWMILDAIYDTQIGIVKLLKEKKDDKAND